jgi:hypothetical protein
MFEPITISDFNARKEAGKKIWLNQVLGLGLDRSKRNFVRV